MPVTYKQLFACLSLVKVGIKNKKRRRSIAFLIEIVVAFKHGT